jgi:hypothetical protein
MLWVYIAICTLLREQKEIVHGLAFDFGSGNLRLEILAEEDALRAAFCVDVCNFDSIFTRQFLGHDRFTPFMRLFAKPGHVDLM